jgi:NAD(P)-dependent dehydrogenase (short-subunit alcohol dehydrogenase family)
VPIGRLGTTADIAYAAVYLCSDTAAGYVSGHTLVVDGAEVRVCDVSLTATSMLQRSALVRLP